MAKTKYFVIDPNGVKHTRSTSRIYSHAVLYQRTKEDYLATIPAWKATEKKNGQYYLDCIANGYHKNLMHFPHYVDDKARQAADVQEAIERLDGCATAEEFAERLAERMRAKAEATDWNEWFCDGWCGRLDLAQKLAAKRGVTMIVPALTE